MSRSAEEIAQLCIDELDDLRSVSRRLAVVGQIQYSAEGPPHTVVLGPFSARGTLDSPEKFLRATEGGSAARQAGQDLAWDTKTGKGRGRFLLAPAFLRPRAAWDFFRGVDAAPVIAKAMEDLPLKHTGPVCLCGLREGVICHAHPEGR